MKTYLSHTPITQDQIQIQIHGLKFDEIQIRRNCICMCICKHKYVFDPSLDHYYSTCIYLRNDQRCG